MEKRVFALVLFIAIGIAAADQVDLIRGYMWEGETLETRGISTSFGNYTLGIINSQDSIMVADFGPTLIMDETLTYNVLKEEYLSQNTVSVDMEQLVSYVDEFNTSRHPEQDTCEQYTGTNRFPCTDFSNCRYACLSSPVCRGMFEGEGDQFIYAIQGWKERDSQIDSSIVGFREDVWKIPENPLMASSASGYVQTIWDKATEIQANKLFLPQTAGGYEFCPQVNFSFSKLNDSWNGLAQLNLVLAKLPEIQQNANTIRAITEDRVSRKRSEDIVYQYQEAFSQAQSNLTGTKDFANKARGLVDSKTLTERLNALNSVMNEIKQLGEEKNYTGALALNSSYFETAKAVSSYAGSLIANYSRTDSARKNLSARLDTDSNLTRIGNYFAGEYSLIKGNLDLLSAGLKTPVKEEKLSGIEVNITVLSTRLTDMEEKAKKTLELLGRIDATRKSLRDLVVRAEEYKQVYDLKSVNSSLDAASGYALSAKFFQAEESLTNATNRINEYRTTLETIIPEIEIAQKEYSTANAYLGERKDARFLFLGADSKRAEEVCGFAKDTVYSKPKESVQYSLECRNAIDSELQNLEYKKYGLVVAVLVLLFLFYKWARKREWSFVVG